MSFTPLFTGISAAAIFSSVLGSSPLNLEHIAYGGMAFSLIGRCLSRMATMYIGRWASGSRSVRYVDSSYVY